jgi:DNA-binding CsgD family transcriptional regulator
MTRCAEEHEHGFGFMPTATLSAYATDVAHLYGAVDSGQFPRHLQLFLQKFIAFDDMTIFCHPGESPPDLVWSSFEPEVTRTGVRNYLEATYVMDPFVRVFRLRGRAGAYRGADLARRLPVAKTGTDRLPVSIVEHEELGFRTVNWPANLSELTLMFDLGGGGGGAGSSGGRSAVCCNLSLYRSVRRGRFSKAEARRASALTPVVSGSFSTHWQNLHARLGDADAAPVLAVLSPRERTVIQMVSEGFSSEAISAVLDISQETVRTHRKRAYRKLEISSQAELFALLRPARGARRDQSADAGNRAKTSA